jgi:LPS-assembly protein
MAPMLGNAADPKDAYKLTADNQEYVEETFWRGSGNVKVQYQDISISCDEMELNLVTRELTARGSVILDQGTTRFTASELRYDLRSKTGLFTDATAESPPSYYFTGAELEKLDDTHYRLKDATFTSCGTDDKPPWKFKIRSALIEDQGYGRFKGTSFHVKGAPVMYVPYLLWPVKTERAAGLLMPSYGYSKQRGFYLGNALYLPIGRSYDTTIYLDLYSQGHYGLGTEWRWAPGENTRGQITAYGLRHKDGEIHWKVNGRHKQDNFLGFQLMAEVEDLDDITFFQEFERSFDKNTLRSLYSFFYLSRAWGPATLNLRADRRTTFLPKSEVVDGVVVQTSQTIELNQLPEMELRVRSTRIGRSSLYWSLVSSLNMFQVDRGEELQATYGRADIYPQLTYTLPGPPWLTITPRIGGRATYYPDRLTPDKTAFAGEAIDRTYLEGGLDIVGPSFSRIFNRSIGSFEKFKHLIEPRIEYRYRSLYMSEEDDPAEIPRFDEVDSTFADNQVRVTLANRFFGRNAKELSARELASLEVYQDYSFTDPLNAGVIDGIRVESQKGPLGAILRLTPSTAFSLDGRAEYDTLYDNLRSTSVSAKISPGDAYTNLTWYQSYDRTTGESSSSQIRTAFGLRGSERRLNVDLHLSYNIEEKEFQQQRVRMHYAGSCWGISLEYRDQTIGLYPSRDYRIIIDLKDVGRLFEIQGGLNSMNE